MFKSISLFIKKYKFILIIFLVALIIRVPGITHGLPLILSTDEPSYVGSVIGLRFSSELNRFDWPHTHFYLGYFVFLIFYYIRAVFNNMGLENLVPILWHDPSSYYVVLRSLNVLLGSLTIIPVFLSAEQLFSSKKMGLAAALIFALIPFHIRESSLALLDIALTFWISWFIYFSIRIINNPTNKNFILSGVFMGLAFGTKYNAIFYYAFFALCVLYSVLKMSSFRLFFIEDYKKLFSSLKELVSKSYFVKYFLNLSSFLAVYLATNYQVVTDFDLFWSHKHGRGFLFQLDNIRPIPWFEYPRAMTENLFSQPINDLGVILYVILFLLTILFLFFNYRNKKIVLTFLFPLVMYFYISTKSRSPSHYFMFLYPLLVLSLTLFIRDASIFFSKTLEKPKFTVNKMSFALFIIVIAFMLFPAVKTTHLLSRKDTRNILHESLDIYYKEDIPVYYYGNDLAKLDFGSEAKKITRLDDENIEINNVPFYIIIGIKNVDYNSLVVDMKHEEVRGWTSKFLRDAELNQYVSNNKRYGPPIYVFKVPKVYEE